MVLCGVTVVLMRAELVFAGFACCFLMMVSYCDAMLCLCVVLRCFVAVLLIGCDRVALLLHCMIWC